MTNTTVDDKWALIDLDGTVADYDARMVEYQRKLQGPEEIPYSSRYKMLMEPPHMEARRKMIQRQAGFWSGLKPLPMGFEVIEEMRLLGFHLHVLTKGPMTTVNAWGEKVEWCREHLPDAIVTVTSDKSSVYGRVLFDDFPPYFEKWIDVRPRGLVICLASALNEESRVGGLKEHPQVFRYDGTNRTEMKTRLKDAYERLPGNYARVGISLK